MFTLDTLEQARWIRRWKCADGNPGFRPFFYANPWRVAVDRLPGPTSAWVIRPASPRGRVLGLVERFAVGDPKAHLVRPHGDGMDPPFKRLDPPNAAVVEMRTAATRTFGFLARTNTYVALFLAAVEELKAPNAASDPYIAYAEKVNAFISRVSSSEIDRISPVDELITDPPQ